MRNGFLACVLALSGVVEAGAAEVRDPSAVPTAAEALQRGEARTGTLGPAQPLRFPFTALKGEYVRLVALQKGVDLVLRVVDAEGRTLGEIDSPNGAQGPEPLGFEAPASGTFVAEVACLDPAARPGAFELRIAYTLAPEVYARYRMVDVEEEDFARATGTFEMGPGHRLLVGWIGGIYLDRAKPSLLVVDLQTRELLAMNAAGPRRYFAGADLQEPYPVATEVEFLEGTKGEADRLRITKSGSTLEARRVDPLSVQRVEFRNGDVVLRGWLTLPARKGPHPAIVHVNGSSASTGEPFVFGSFLAGKGIAYLGFDKRGAGRSTGDWRKAGLPELATDVLAGVAHLKARPDIDPTRIGLWGASQGGWVGALAAAQSRDVAFFISQVGSGVSVAENMVHEMHSVMKESGLPDDEQREATGLLREAYGMISDGVAPEKVKAHVGPRIKEGWAPFFQIVLAPPEFYFWEWLRLNGRMEPYPSIAAIRQPVLWLLGEKDTQVPTEVSAPRLREAFEKAGNRAFALHVFPSATHGLLEAPTGSGPLRMVEGYWDVIGHWLDATVVKRR